MLLKALPVVCTQSSITRTPRRVQRQLFTQAPHCTAVKLSEHTEGCAKVMHEYNYPTECEELEFMRIWALGWEQIHTS